MYLRCLLQCLYFYIRILGESMEALSPRAKALLLDLTLAGMAVASAGCTHSSQQVQQKVSAEQHKEDSGHTERTFEKNDNN